MIETVLDQLEKIRDDIENARPGDAEALEAFRIRFLGTKNIIKPFFREMGKLPPDQRKPFGQRLNALKNLAEAIYHKTKTRLEEESRAESSHGLDLTAPGEPFSPGARHPVALVMQEIIEIFSSIGFVVAEEREIEDEWHNFTAMNTPDNHPARDMQDTFYLKDQPNMLLRTHTSSVQARVMTTQPPPIRIIAPGRVYRNETISARSHCQFHQVEGLYVDEGVSFADMKQTLYYFARTLYGRDVVIRFRPSYFPFTEPSAEMDIYWGLNNENDYRITKGTGWLEIMGCGMVDPATLEACGIDSERYTGFAFGMGIERQAMLKYRVNDIRLFFENDIRFLRQFGSAIV